MEERVIDFALWWLFYSIVTYFSCEAGYNSPDLLCLLIVVEFLVMVFINCIFFSFFHPKFFLMLQSFKLWNSIANSVWILWICCTCNLSNYMHCASDI